MSRYEGMILSISIGGEYTDKVFCSYEYANGKQLECYGLGKSGSFVVSINDVVSIDRETESPLKKLPDESLFDTDKGLFKLKHRDHDSVLSVKSSKGVWFNIAEVCNLHHLLYYIGADADTTIKTSADIDEVSSVDYGLFDVDMVKFEKVNLAA